jgi:hypothetical protein
MAILLPVGGPVTAAIEAAGSDYTFTGLEDSAFSPVK